MILKLDKFEGPLSLLMQLIEKEELDITQVSLAKVADQYMEHIKTLAVLDPEHMADFLVVAARLLLIKSKALLPYLYPEEEEEIAELEHQLKMYQEFVEASKVIQAMIGKKRFMFARPFNRKAPIFVDKQFSAPKNVDKNLLSTVFSELIMRLMPAQKVLEEAVLERKINIEEKILQIEQRLLERVKFGFNQLIEKAENKTEIIVSFLAMLELVRMRQVDATQGELFGDIEISKI
ncbi:segregation/condensation protein A [Candidatus Falkowbacteria bacterium]|nr:segregation/condensation protein A [Candidatus Falkowbacteria bacterium]